jgi:hypothetical protein
MCGVVHFFCGLIHLLLELFKALALRVLNAKLRGSRGVLPAHEGFVGFAVETLEPAFQRSQTIISLQRCAVLVRPTVAAIALRC